MAFTESWVETDPDGSVITGSLLDDYQRQHKRASRERMEGDPSDPNSGLFEYGTFAATAMVRAGTARVYAVTTAAIPALTLQDGRIAITTDTRRLYHLRTTGVVELDYLTPAGDASASPTFDIVHAAAFDIIDFAAYEAGRVYMDIANGLILSGIGGVSYDAVILNGAGAIAIGVNAGTVNVAMGGTLFVTGAMTVGGALTVSGALSVGSLAVTGAISAAGFYINAVGTATSGVIRLATGTGLNWRNAGNTADIAVLYTSGAITHLGAETSISLDAKTAMPVGSGVGALCAFLESFQIQDNSKTSIAALGNIILRLSSNAAGADCTLQFTDNVSYNQYISGRANNFFFTIAGTVPVLMDVNGIATVGLALVDDQSQKLTLARYSAGTQWSYLKVATSSLGLRVTNAAGAVDVMILDNSGGITFAGAGVFGGALFFSGSAVATTAGFISIGGNTSTTASNYGGGGVTALPAQPRGYLPIYLGATQYKVPYYEA